MHKISLQTSRRTEFIDITDRVEQILAGAGVSEGV